jgi:hypothetical protein
MAKMSNRRRIVLIIVGVIAFCCVAFLAFAFIRAGIASLAGWTPTPTRTATVTRTPTFTETPKPTHTPTFTKTPKPTNTYTPTPVPTDTRTPTYTPTVISPPTDTPTPRLPTSTPTLRPPTDTPIPAPSTDTPVLAPAKVIIVTVNKGDEYVDIRNIGDLAQDLTGWILLSEKGDQACTLAGVLGSGETLRIWAQSKDADKGGYNCGFDTSIWNNSEPDPAVLYNAQGVEVDRKTQ